VALYKCIYLLTHLHTDIKLPIVVCSYHVSVTYPFQNITTGLEYMPTCDTNDEDSKFDQHVRRYKPWYASI